MKVKHLSLRAKGFHVVLRHGVRHIFDFKVIEYGGGVLCRVIIISALPLLPPKGLVDNAVVGLLKILTLTHGGGPSECVFLTSLKDVSVLESFLDTLHFFFAAVGEYFVLQLLNLFLLVNRVLVQHLRNLGVEVSTL